MLFFIDVVYKLKVIFFWHTDIIHVRCVVIEKD